MSTERRWLAEIDRNLSTIERIKERGSKLKKIGLSEDVNLAVNSLIQKNKLTERRLSMIKYPRLIRIVPFARLRAFDGYEQFSDWKSAIKDIFHP